MLQTISKVSLLASVFLLFLSPLTAQETDPVLEDQLQKFHFAGLSYGLETRTIEEDYQETSSEVSSDTRLIGLNYSSLIGSRLGYYSDAFLLIPLEFSSQGISLDYTGGIGWNIWRDKWGILPGAGFHAGYSCYKDDDFADGADMSYFSFGPGAGIKILYRLTETVIPFVSCSFSYDTLEFSSNPNYTDRDNAFKRTIDYRGSIGLGVEL